MGEFLLFKKNKDNKSYSLRGLKTLKEKGFLKTYTNLWRKQLMSTTISNNLTILKPASVLGN